MMELTDQQKESCLVFYAVPITAGRLGQDPAKSAEIKTALVAGWVMFHCLLPVLSGISAFIIKTVTENALFPQQGDEDDLSEFNS